MIVKIVRSETEKQTAFQIRHTVFVDEQQVPVHLEMDEFDEVAIHFIGIYENEAIGASRLRFVDRAGKLERICLLKRYRGQSFGKKLISKMEEEIKARGFNRAKLNAQTHAISFYKKIGYKVVSEPFIDAGIPHVTMMKQL